MNDFLFQVADTAFHLHVGDMADARPMLPSYAPFFVEKTTCDLIFNMNVGNGLVSFTPQGEELGQFDCGGNTHGIYRQPDGGYVITIFSGKDRPACALETSADFSRCRATLFGSESERTFGLNNALMIAFAFAGAHHGIVLMHASVTMYGGGATSSWGRAVRARARTQPCGESLFPAPTCSTMIILLSV